MKLIIDRQKWFRGKGYKYSRLLITNKDADEDLGKKCCVGFYLSACGVPDEQIADVETASTVMMHSNKYPEHIEWMMATGGYNSADAGQLYSDNDNPTIDALEREKYIAKTFSRHNVEVEFIG